MDWFAKALGFVMIALTLYVAVSSRPPVGAAIYHSFIPEKIDVMAVITLVDGTVGVYISFAGAHRLFDAGIKGKENLARVTSSSLSAIIIASTMRILLFMAALGIVVHGGTLDPANPAASVFERAAGGVGYKIFGIVLWSAAITSVIGSAYTSISFVTSFHSYLERNRRFIITIFIIISTIIFSLIGKPVNILIVAGALNGLILPIALSLILLPDTKHQIVGEYRHPLWMSIVGWIVVVAMSWMGVITITSELSKLF